MEGKTQSGCCQKPKGLSLSQARPPLNHSHYKRDHERQEKGGLIAVVPRMVEPRAAEREEHCSGDGRDRVETEHATEQIEARGVVEEIEKNERYSQRGKHIHPGEEVVYVLDGATLQLPDGSQRQFPTGAATINIRNVPHAGFKVAGDKALKMLTVHIVDKGKPVTEVAK